MPISEKKKIYLFDTHHERRLKSFLENRSLAICFWSDTNAKSSFIQRTKIRKTPKIKKRIRIVICKLLLPRHCDEKLVEQVLDFLQKCPEDNELLKILADYTKNDLFEHMGYWGMLVGTTGSCCAVSVFYTIVVVYPFVLQPCLGVFSLCIVAASLTLFILNMFYDNALGLKFGRWTEDRIKGTPGEPANLKELAAKLMTRIKEDEIEETINEESRVETQKDTYLKTIDLEELKRKIMAGIRNDAIGEALEDAVEEFINENSGIESTEDFHPITIDLEEIKIKLMTRIPSDEVEKALKATEEAIEAFFNEDRRIEPQKDYRFARQCLDHFWSTGSPRQAAEMKTFECQRYV